MSDRTDAGLGAASSTEQQFGVKSTALSGPQVAAEQTEKRNHFPLRTPRATYRGPLEAQMRLGYVVFATGLLFAGLWTTPLQIQAQQNATTDVRPDGKGDRTRQTTAVKPVIRNQSGDMRADGKGDRTRQRRPRTNPAAAPATGNGIDYHGGPILLGTTNMYYIWYGNWGTSPAVSILTNLAQNIGGSPYFNINTTYSNGSGQAVSNSVAFAGHTTDNYSRGTALGDSDIAAIVSNAISSGGLPKDTNGVYFVLTSSDVQETSGFCTIYCGWHTSGSILGSDIK